MRSNRKFTNVKQILPFYLESNSFVQRAIKLSHDFEKSKIQCELVVMEEKDSYDLFSPNIKKFTECKSNSKTLWLVHAFPNAIVDLSLIKKLRGSKILIRHFSPDPELLAPYSWILYQKHLEVRKAIKAFSQIFDYAIGDSIASCNELSQLGLTQTSCFPFLDMPRKFSQYPIGSIKETATYWLSFGVFSPEQRFEDVIRLFDHYRKRFHRDIHLLIVGELHVPEYYQILEDLVNSLLLQKRVAFAHQIGTSELKGLSESAECMISFAEAPISTGHFQDVVTLKLPYVSLLNPDSCSILGERNVGFGKRFHDGIHFPLMDYPLMSEFMNLLASDSALKQKIILNQRQRALDIDSRYSSESVVGQFQEFLV